MTSEPDRFLRAALTADGFGHWLTWQVLRGGAISRVPDDGGVYVVFRESDEPPSFLDANPGGRFKGQDPTASEEALRANWVAGANVLYIGKADKLRRRLTQYMRFGAGEPIGHWGGRLIWQLQDSPKLLVAWKRTPGEVPKGVETGLIEEFRALHAGQPPFANNPHQLGR